MEIYAWQLEAPDDAPPEIGCAGHFYLHGTLERENGYDLCGMLRKDYPKKDGIYDVTVKFNDGKPDKPARFYYWKVNGRYRGLVCNIDDEYANRIAQYKFDERAEWL